jgi:hypothetical protein
MISRDQYGNIFATRLSRYDVIIRGNQKFKKTCIPDEVFASDGRLPAAEKTKVCSTFALCICYLSMIQDNDNECLKQAVIVKMPA